MQLTGHKTPNGGYITKAELIKAHNKFIKEQTENKKQYEAEQKKQEQLSFSIIHEQFKAQQTEIETKKLHYEQCKQFVSYAAETIKNYNEYLIAYDIANNDIFTIQSDISKGKTTKEQVKKIYAIALNYIDNLKNTIPFDLLIA